MFVVGFYPGNFYQPNPSSILQQPLHNMNPCLLPHHVPVQVPHAQVKVLIHNPDTPHDCAAFSNLALDDGHNVLINSVGSAKGKKVNSESKNKNAVKPKKKLEKKVVKTSEEEMDFEKSVIVKQDEGSGHGWSWSGDPEWKPVQNIVSRSCCTLVGRQMALFLYTGAKWKPVQNIGSRSCCTLVGRQMALFLYTGANWREREKHPLLLLETLGLSSITKYSDKMFMYSNSFSKQNKH